MGLNRSIVGLVFLTVIAAAPVHATGRLVYTGNDPSCHFDQPEPEAVTLAANAVQWVTRSINPAVAILAVLTDPDCDTAGLLAAAGFTNVTTVLSADLATTSLGGFAAVWVGPFPFLPDLYAAANNVQNFVNNGGGLILEPEPNGGGLPMVGFGWAPFGNQIGANPSLSSNTITIVDPTHPVMAGLTDGGLSSWEESSHSDFSTPQAAGFTVLTIDDNDIPNIIAREASAPQMPAPVMAWPAMMGLIVLLFGLGVYSVGRKPSRLQPDSVIG